MKQKHCRFQYQIIRLKHIMIVVVLSFMNKNVRNVDKSLK